MKILLVDDSKTMRNIQRKSLAALGDVEFAEAGDGVEALQVIGATPQGFGLVLIDWNMPNMDGLTLVGRIRGADKKTPLIMCTTEAEKTRVLAALKARVNHYLIKPLTAEALLDEVQPN